MNTYEVIKPCGESHTVKATGWTWDKSSGEIRFYDGEGERVGRIRKGEWTELHMRSALAVADKPAPTTAISGDEFATYYGM